MHLNLGAPCVKRLGWGGNQAFYIVIPLLFSTKTYASHLGSVISSSRKKQSLWGSRKIRINLLCFLKFTLHVKKTTVVAPICACCLRGTPSTAVPVPLVCSWKTMAGRAKQVGTWLFSTVTVLVWFGFTASELILEEVSWEELPKKLKCHFAFRPSTKLPKWFLWTKVIPCSRNQRLLSVFRVASSL